MNIIKSWFTLRGRKYHSGVAFALHRLTGLIMVAFVLFHFLFFSTSLELGYSFLPLFGIIASFHGFNGLRLILNELGVGYRYRELGFQVVVALWLATSTVFILLVV